MPVLAESDAAISFSVNSVPWLAIVGVMILLQLIILVVLTGRPRAVAVIGLVLPIMGGVCAVVATDIIMSWTRGFEADRHQFLPLLYAIWGLCAMVALVTVVLCVLPMRCRAFPTPKPANGPKSPEEARNYS
jgi:hypothetical protein